MRRWEDFATNDERIEYHLGSDNTFIPEAGDIVLYDRVLLTLNMTILVLY